jgi:aspartyl-tRNA(Asn)/glutamyl-tRNA(Gln) amidotransferase subunit C
VTVRRRASRLNVAGVRTLRYDSVVAITRDDVRRVAALARLRLKPDEEERLAADLDKILDAFAKLQALDTTGVPPARALAEATTPLRDDAVTNPPATDDLLMNAPAPEGRYFRVPKIIE